MLPGKMGGAGTSDSWGTSQDTALSPTGAAGMRKGQIVSVCRQLKLTGLVRAGIWGGREKGREGCPPPRFQLSDCELGRHKLRKIITTL